MQPNDQRRQPAQPTQPVPARMPQDSTPTSVPGRAPAEPTERHVPLVAMDPLAGMQGQPETSNLPGNQTGADTSETPTARPALAPNAQGGSKHEISWSAKEYISPDKNTLWYIILALLVVAIIAVDVLLMKSFTVSVLAVTIAVALVVMSVRPARTITYTMTDTGLYVDKQFLKFADYKAFGLVHDGKGNTIMLIPVQRWMPGFSVYFPADKGEVIVDLLAQKLPNQAVKLDLMDKIANALRL